MDINKMLSFCTVYECQNISKASEKLFCSQPALSKQIHSLEIDLGYPLFVRNGKKITINENGKIFYRFAKNVLNDYQLLKRELYIKNNTFTHEVRFGTTNLIGTYLIPPVLSKFKNEYPTTPVNFIVNFFPTILQLLEEDVINFAIIPANQNILNNPTYICDAFLDDEFVLILPPNHPLTQKDKIYLEDIQDYTFLVSRDQSATRDFVGKTLEENNIHLSNVINMDNIYAIKHGVINHLGISILSKNAVEKDESFGVLKYRKFEGIEIKRKLYIVYKTKHTFFEEEALFIKQFIQNLE